MSDAKEGTMGTDVTRRDDRAPANPGGRGIVDAFLSGKAETTLRAYQWDLAEFAAFLGEEDVRGAAARLLALDQGEANAVAHEWRSALLDGDPPLSPATVNRRLSALRSLVKLARSFGEVAWTLDVPGVRSQSYRDTRGPGSEGVRALLAALDDRGDDPKARRDRAAIRLLYDLALRRGEVVGLDLADVDLDGRAVMVTGKGTREPVPVTLPAPTADALAAWIEARGDHPGPLFLSLAPADDRDPAERRLSGTSVYRIVRDLGKRAGVTARPHGLRHAAITEALDRTDGDVRRVARFSRHADVRVLQTYDDNGDDLAGEVAEIVASTA